jgi:hypothetical protein
MLYQLSYSPRELRETLVLLGERTEPDVYPVFHRVARLAFGKTPGR